MILKINDRIRTRRVEFFNDFSLSLRFDAIASSFSFKSYFNPGNADHKDMYCVSHYHIVTLEHNGQLLLTGYIASQGFRGKNVREGAAIGGYSLPGVLEDCQIPSSAYPLQNNGLSLLQIAEKCLKPFGLNIIVDSLVGADMGTAYEKTTATPTQTVKDYLSQLASQKNIILTHDERGNVVFTRARTKQRPLLHYGEGGLPFLSMGLNFPGQPMHSEITVMKQADTNGGNAGEFTIKNPYVQHVFRPRVMIQNSGTDNDTERAARNALAGELKNMVVTIVADTWEIDGKVIKPGTIITVTNPEIYLYKKTALFVESVTLEGDNAKLTATLTCVIPEVYSGDIPRYIFEGINEH